MQRCSNVKEIYNEKTKYNTYFEWIVDIDYGFILGEVRALPLICMVRSLLGKPDLHINLTCEQKH